MISEWKSNSLISTLSNNILFFCLSVKLTFKFAGETKNSKTTCLDNSENKNIIINDLLPIHFFEVFITVPVSDQIILDLDYRYIFL